MKQRILAIAGALALVALAIVARTQFGGDSGGGGSSGGGKPVVACTPDLMSVCDALAEAGKIANDPPTLDLDKAAAPAPEIDAWITWDAIPGVANFDADADGRSDVWGTSIVLGASPLAVSTRRSGAVPLPDGCSMAALMWACLNNPDTSSLTVGVGTGRTAESLVRLYPIAATLIPVDGDIRDVTSTQISAIIDSPTAARFKRPFAEEITLQRQGPAQLDVVVAPLGALSKVSGLTTVQPDGGIEMVAVLTLARGSDLDPNKAAALGKRGTDAISELGLEPGTGSLAPAERAGDLFALRKAAS